MEFHRLEKSLENGVLTITFNRSAQLNAMDRLALTELDFVIAEAEKDPEVKAIIITGSGKAFVAGADISAMVGMIGTEAVEFAAYGQKVFSHIENAEKVVIAAINGYALGGGCELAMSCDIRYASNLAKLGQPEINLGVIPGFAGTQRLPRLVGKGMAMELLVTGNTIDANEALRIGLVDKVFAPEELFTEARKTAELIASKCPRAVTLNKKALRAGLPKYDEKTEAQLFGKCFESGDAKEGMNAFLNKTKPNWR